MWVVRILLYGIFPLRNVCPRDVRESLVGDTSRIGEPSLLLNTLFWALIVLIPFFSFRNEIKKTEKFLKHFFSTTKSCCLLLRFTPPLCLLFHTVRKGSFFNGLLLFLSANAERERLAGRFLVPHHKHIWNLLLFRAANFFADRFI